LSAGEGGEDGAGLEDCGAVDGAGLGVSEVFGVGE
jgi:hypothetical protein